MARLRPSWEMVRPSTREAEAPNGSTSPPASCTRCGDDAVGLNLPLPFDDGRSAAVP